MYLIVGAGLSGATIARRLAEEFGKDVLVIDERDHIGGNCYDEIDRETSIRVSKYGAHLFHTNHQRVWEFVNRFSEWERWEHVVMSKIDGKLVPFPVNCTTINVLCDENIQTEQDAEKWLENNLYKGEITNSEEMARSRVGDALYKKLIYDYTYKQWGKHPHELRPEVLARIPFRKNFDTRYFQDKYQALPKNGYTAFFEKLLSHPKIHVRLGINFFSTEFQKELKGLEGIVYTGPIDKYFSGRIPEKLEYRSIEFTTERIMNHSGYYQQTSVVNYPGSEVEHTRIVEYKHFLNQDSPHTIIVKETTNDSGPPYYPVPNERNQTLYEKFRRLAEEEEEQNRVYFVGRLANYKYFNMDQAILNALEFVDSLCDKGHLLAVQVRKDMKTEQIR